MLQELNTSLS
uniref:Uncharacterized protein n=1 Tax=Anguilla anguilla TaxID=7936 RepID=A0A0E9RSH1_ANGAN